mmetsp:Transcript_24059/g.27460  ORF Transcript_24059/g.27460 Transcript_24059/m.27460 type:complete len:904 (+) Transcript_24059:418-3129(+)
MKLFSNKRSSQINQQRPDSSNSTDSSYKPPPVPVPSASSQPQQQYQKQIKKENSNYSFDILRSASNISRNARKKKLAKKMNDKHHRKNIKRYRGFSTSISSLFLDEQVVCGAMSWCGLLASSRTEHLLHARNEHLRITRNTSEDTNPSRILGILMMASVAFISLTYLFWGFGEVDSDEQMQYHYYGRDLLTEDHEKEDDIISSPHNRVSAASAYYIPGVMRFCDYDRRFGKPFQEFVWKFVKSTPTSYTSASALESTESSAISSLSMKTQDIIHQQQLMQQRHLSSSWMDNQELASNLRVITCIIFLIVLGLFGRRRRMKTRFDVLKARTNDDLINFGSFNTRNNDVLRKEDKYEGACSHTLCGCYPVDRKVILPSGEEYNDEEDQIAPGFKKKHEDILNRWFSLLMTSCCGKMCKVWCQCCSMCALAQEAREVRLLVPPKLQRVDFITHQPWKEYFRDIYNLRLSWKEKNVGVRRRWGSHFGALSTLSRSIIFAFVIATVVIILTEQFNPRAFFSWADACILILTFVQSFIVLGIVHGIFHKSDLSLDAVIKFFAAGFIVATPTAFIFEALIMTVLMSGYYFIGLIVYIVEGEDAGGWWDDNYRFVLIIADVLNAFLVAALVEEICKYYTFRTVEHPDLIFLTGLDRSKRDMKSSYGGNSSYAFSSDNNALFARCDTFESAYSYNSSKKRSYRGSNITPMHENKVGTSRGDNDENDEPDVRTLRQKAAAVTTAMISGAVGLACAENFIYVFFLGGSNAQEEITMLLFRSIFPVHALVAAMQSIGVIKKFLEQSDVESTSRIGVGKIILPAVLLHGSFDTVLMTVNSVIDFVEEDAENQGGNSSYSAFVLNTVAAAVVVSVMLSGLLWYFFAHRQQKARLKALEAGLLPVDNCDEDEQGLELL